MVAAGEPVLLVRKISVLPDSGVFEADAAKVLRIVGGRVEAVEHHALIANHPIGAFRGVRVDPSRIHVRLGAGDEERSGLMHRVQAPEVHVAAIHDVETARLDEQQVEHVDIVQLAIADVDEGRNGAAQIEQGVQFDGRLVGTKRRPVEQAQAEIDGGRVQRIDARIELQQRRFLSIQRSCAGDQPLGQAVIDAPIAPVQRIGQRRSRGRRLQSHVEKLGLIGRHAGLDIAQRLAPGELGESHDAKQVRAAQRAHVNTDYYEARQQINRTLLSAHFRSIPRIHFVNRNQRTEHKRVSPPISVPKSGTLPLNRFDLSRLARRS